MPNYLHRRVAAFLAPVFFLGTLARAQGSQAGSNGTRPHAQTQSRPAAKPPAGVAQTQPHRRVNLSGLWLFKRRENDFLYHRLEQKGDEITDCVLSPPKSCSDEITIENVCSPPDQGGPCLENTTFKGRFTDDTTLELTAQFDTTGHPTWAHDTLIIEDPDHIRYGSVKFPMWRVAPPAEDVACDERNSSHTTPEYAFLRAKVAFYAQDAVRAACWMHAAAVSGDVRSQALYSSLLYNGDGVAQDYNAAFQWAQKSAQQHEFFGEFMLALMYQTGKGAPVDPEKSKEWLAKAREGYKAKIQEMQASSGWAGMSPEQQAVAMRATLAVFNIFRGAGAADAAVMAERMRNPRQSLSSAEQAAARDPNFKAGQQQMGSGLDTILGMILGTDEQYNQAVKQAHQ
jgi:hypothetical protein